MKESKQSGTVYEKEDLLFDESSKRLAANTFYLLHSISDWEKTGIASSHLTVAILFPLGVSPCNFSVCVSKDRNTLTTALTCPDPLVNLNNLTCKWQLSKGFGRVETYHAKLKWFKCFLKTYKSRSTDSIESIANINLFFQFQTHSFEEYNLEWTDSNARMILLELWGHEV